jgi:putative holliday junction resolvase
MKYLGIDYGFRRIGTALSDDTLTLAFPLKTLQNSKTVLEEVLKIIESEKVTRVIIGESKNNDMKDNEIMEHVRSFKKQLEEKGIAVEFHPEMYSSAQVVSIMGSENKAIDASAAAIILQNYLDLQKHS